MKHISEVLPEALAHVTRQVREIPALFSAPMVRANLAGTKTMTRRPLYVLTKRISTATFDPRYPLPPMGPGHTPISTGYTLSNWHKAKAGDRLWQRETWKRGCAHADDDTVCIAYAASQEPETHGLLVNNITRPPEVDRATWREDEKWTPSIHMPRWACRFTADITAVRIERLQDINEADAVAEGIERQGDGWRCYTDANAGVCYRRAVNSYRSLWESINGPGSWASNPWVVVISYKETKR